ncbi:hypothetical protein Poly41_15820 [Novipirellula artificiosorum]|uniref:Uncharacterized protein n=2 Tax=Novipirellula artificiosorum TaxID=2528016 RepID=A0A5C6DY31_9BACT|nr:hypothetical protein Poly41_15820 [Novipirellula artificiosorum]
MVVWFLELRKLHALSPNPLAKWYEALAVVRYLYYGMCLGTLCGIGWAASAAKTPWLRFAVQAIAILLFALTETIALADIRFQSALINGIGLVLGQNILFAWLGVPHFNDPRDRFQRSRRQFSIADIVLATAAFALLIRFAGWYEPPIDAVPYWLGLAGICAGLPIVSSLVCRAMLSRKLSNGFYRLGLAGLLTIPGAAALAYAQLSLSGIVGNPNRVVLLTALYFSVFAGYFIAIAMTAAAGRRSALADTPVPGTSR